MSTVLLIEAALCRGTASGQGQAFGGAFYGKARNADCGGGSPKKRREKQKTCRFHRPEKLSVRRGAFPRDGKHAALPGGLGEASGREKPQKNYGCPAGRWMHRPSAAAQASIKASE